MVTVCPDLNRRLVPGLMLRVCPGPGLVLPGLVLPGRLDLVAPGGRNHRVKQDGRQVGFGAGVRVWHAGCGCACRPERSLYDGAQLAGAVHVADELLKR